MSYKSLVQVIKEHNAGKDLDEGLIPMYKKTKFEGKEFDRKKEIKSFPLIPHKQANCHNHHSSN